jgi:hypothetical protein
MVNAFWLDRDLDQAVRWHVDAHVTSSVHECSLVLTTALHLAGMDDDELSVTHQHHPLPQWASQSLANWEMLRNYTERVHDEWRYRWDHEPSDVHGSWERILALDDGAIRALAWPSDEATEPPQCTNNWQCEDYVEAYRYYYANEKAHLFEWAKDRERPPWIDEYTVPEGPTGDSDPD